MFRARSKYNHPSVAPCADVSSADSDNDDSLPNNINAINKKHTGFCTSGVKAIMAFLVLSLIFLSFLKLQQTTDVPVDNTFDDTDLNFEHFISNRFKNPDIKWFYDHELDGVTTNKPLIIGHRGFSGALPEHTVEGYKKAVEFGADIIECDAALTKDLAVVCLHECWMNVSTDVAEKFGPDRISEYFVPSFEGGKTVRDYFSVDFTLEELKTLRKVERRTFRNHQYNGQFEIATLREMIGVAKSSKRPVGLHIEIKDPKFFNRVVTKLREVNKTFEDIVLEVLHKEGYNSKRSPCFIQSFDEDSLKYTANITSLPLVLLLDYPEDTSEARLKSISQYAYGIGPDKRHLIQVDEVKKTITHRSFDLVKRCRDLKLRIHAYTFRNEYLFLPWDYHQDSYNELTDFFRLGIDGYFSDFPETVYNFWNCIYSQKNFASFPDWNLVNFSVLLCLLMSCIFNFCF